MNQLQEDTPQLDIPTVVGRVRWFDKLKGYGFITNPEGEDVFVHYSVIPGEPKKRNLQEGDTVRYVEGHRRQGLYAVSIVSVLKV